MSKKDIFGYKTVNGIFSMTPVEYDIYLSENGESANERKSRIQKNRELREMMERTSLELEKIKQIPTNSEFNIDDNPWLKLSPRYKLITSIIAPPNSTDQHPDYRCWKCSDGDITYLKNILEEPVMDFKKNSSKIKNYLKNEMGIDVDYYNTFENIYLEVASDCSKIEVLRKVGIGKDKDFILELRNLILKLSKEKPNKETFKITNSDVKDVLFQPTVNFPQNSL